MATEAQPTVIYEVLAPESEGMGAVAVISLNRPERANAQSMQMLYELDDALELALSDDTVRCIVLRANGKHFSAGHDLTDRSGVLGKTWRPRSQWRGFAPHGFKAMSGLSPKSTGKGGESAAEGLFNREREIYKDMAERFRNAPKPTICAVQGKCIAGGLMLCWPCDIIVASDDASFQDMTVAMGVCGVEFFAHHFELGARGAKELLFTGDAITATEAHRLGFVSRVVPRKELEDFALRRARRIARMPLFALQMAKEAVNQAQDAAGRRAGMDGAFSLHQLCHAYNLQRFGIIVDPAGMARPKTQAKL